MMDAFKSGGFGMYPTTIFGLLLVAAAVRYAMSPERRFVPLQLSLGVLTLAAGTLGCVTGAIKSASALYDVPADKRSLFILGLGESLNNVGCALALVALAALVASVGAARLASMTPQRELA
ncbi:MAG TPA: hypothetical protein VGM56_20645 [Byssovorax sp.]|jgi:hypothetical protein